MKQKDSASKESFLFSMQGIEKEKVFSNSLSPTCNTGTLAEMIVATEAMKRGYSVFFPVGHAHKADLILWRPPFSPVTVQVKKATWQKGGAFKFMIGSGKPSCAVSEKDYGLRYTPYKKGDFDVICAYIQERDDFVFYRLNEIAGKSSIRWRPDNGQRVNNWEDIEEEVG